MGDKRTIEGPREIEAEFEDIYRMGRRVSWPEFDAETLVLRACVINGVGDLMYRLQIQFPRGVKVLEPPLRTPVEAHSHLPVHLHPATLDIPSQLPPATIFPDIDTRLIRENGGVDPGTPFGEFDSMGYLAD